MVRSYRGLTILCSLQPIIPCLIRRLLQNYFTQLHESQWVNGKRDLKLSKALFTSKQVSSQDRGLKITRLYKRNVSGRLNLLPGTELRSVSINVNKTRKHFPETIMAPACFSNVPSFQYGKHCFQCQFFLRCKFCLRYTAWNFIENPSMRALAKFLRARASEHPSNYCEQFGQRPNFASAFKLDGTNYDGTIRKKSLW